MCSSRFAQWAVVLFAGALIQCHTPVGEKSGANRTLNLTSVKVSCLGNFGRKLEKFFQARMGDEEISEFIGCFQDSLLLFEKYSEGEQAGLYRPEEIRNFLARFFVRDREITDEHVRQLMNLKVSWLGGQTDSVTRQEIFEFVRSLDVVREEAIRLRPYMSVLNPWVGLERQDRNQSLPSLKDAASALMMTAERLGYLVKPGAGTYQWDSFVVYLRELRRFISDDPQRLEEVWEVPVVQFLKAVKSFAVEPDSEVIQSQHWGSFLKVMASGYALYLKYSYELKPGDILAGQGLEDFIQAGDQTFSWLDRAIEAQPQKVITFEQLNRLIDAAWAFRQSESGVKSRTVQTTIKQFFSKVFGDQSIRPKDRSLAGIDRLVSSRARHFFVTWVTHQQFLDRRESQRSGSSQGLAFSGLEGFRQFGRSGRWNQGASLVQNPAAEFISSLETELKPLFKPVLNVNPKAHILGNSTREREGIRINHFDLSLKNAISPFVSMLIAGYGGDAGRIRDQVGLTQSEMKDFIADFQPLFREAGILHPRAEKVGERLFWEGNFFTYRGNGDVGDNELLDFFEGLELSSFIITNVFMTNRIYDLELARQKDNPVCDIKNPRVDVLGIEQLNRRCFVDNYRFLLSHHLDHASGMRDYLEKLSEEDWEKFMDVLLAVVSPYDDNLGGRGPQLIQFTQLATMNMVVMYVEAIMTRFDTNENGTLETPEAEAAFQVYSRLMGKVLQLMGYSDEDWKRRYGFMYVLQYGEIPEMGFSSIGRIIGRATTGWDVALTRVQLLKAFHLIIASMERRPETQAQAGPTCTLTGQVPRPAVAPEPERRYDHRLRGINNARNPFGGHLWECSEE